MRNQELQLESAAKDFRQARRRAAVEQIMAFLTGKSADLLSFEEVRKQLKATGASVRGLKEIPLDAIVGSVGRYNDFTRSFLPRRDSDQHRWTTVQTIATGLIGFPPIEVYQIGDAYFVLDGNHRVSVARQLGAESIEAYVTEIQTKVQISPDIQPDELLLKAEYANFLDHTQIDVLRPGVDLFLTLPEKYRFLKTQIETRHEQMRSNQPQQDIAAAAAVADWHDTMYAPLAAIIHDQHLLKDFPGRTMADVYVWISEYRAHRQTDGDLDEKDLAAIRKEFSMLPDSKLDAFLADAEYVDFLAQTHLDRLRPKADLRVTVPGQYPILQEHIAVHRYFMGIDFRRDVSYEEAVGHWYDTVYLPIAYIIRQYHMLRDFPNRTVTDLYLWLAEHRADLEKELGWRVRSESAAADLINHFSDRPDRLFSRFGEWLIDVLTPDELESGPPPGQWRKEELSAAPDDCIFRTALVPIRGDAAGWNALKQAALFIVNPQAQLYGLHIVPTDEQCHLPEVAALQDEFGRQCAESDIEGELAVDIGDITRKICERAFWADLVIMSLAHPPGTQPFERMKSGIRTIIRRCSKPIMIVPGSPRPIRRALVAYDGSPKADEALFVSASLAKGCQQLELIVVAAAEIGRASDEILALARSYLRRRNVTAQYIQETGDAGKATIQTAEAQACDLIIMGGYGRSPVLEIMLGSAVDHVLRTSQIPVLICR